LLKALFLALQTCMSFAVLLLLKLPAAFTLSDNEGAEAFMPATPKAVFGDC